MATLKLTIFKAKVLRDGRHKIRIAVCHKQETCYIVTRFIINSLSQFNNGQVVRRPDAGMMNMKLRDALNELQSKLNDIKNIEMYNCRQIKNILIGKGELQEKSTFQQVSNSYIKELIEEGRESYAKLIERNSRYFTEFTKGEFLLEDITPEIIDNYATFLKKKGSIGETTLNMMMSRTRTIINRGIKKGLTAYSKHPFVNYKIRTSIVRECDISIESFNKIRLSEPEEKKYKVARDLFCLSFYLGGINLIDLLSIDFRRKEVIEYVRTKSKNTTQGKSTISIVIPEPAKAIIKTWMNSKTGKLDCGYRLSYPNFSRYLTRSLAALAANLGITEKVPFARTGRACRRYRFRSTW